MSLRKEKIEQIRRNLLFRQQTLMQNLKQATSDMLNDEASFADSVDQASAVTGKALTLQMKNREHDELREISEALRRIDAGTFGECERCSEEISDARMKANPATTLCIDCKNEIEAESNRFPRRF